MIQWQLAATMNPEIIEKTNEIMESLQENTIDETSMAKTIALCQLINYEMKRIDAGGVIDRDGFKTFARIFDKFSAVFLEKGVNADLCEAMNKIANDLRKCS